MARLTGAQILSATGDTKEVEVPEWGGTEDDPDTVLVRGLDTAFIQELMRKGLLNDDGVPLAELDFAAIAARSMVNDDGSRMFTNSKQVAKIAEKTFGPITRIATIAMELAGLGKEDADESDEETGDPKATDSPT